MNITAIEKEIAKTEAKIEICKEKIKQLRQRKLEEENAQIIKLVRSANLSVGELNEMFRPAVKIQDMEEEIDV